MELKNNILKQNKTYVERINADAKKYNRMVLLWVYYVAYTHLGLRLALDEAWQLGQE